MNRESESKLEEVSSVAKRIVALVFWNLNFGEGMHLSSYKKFGSTRYVKSCLEYV